MPKRLNRLSIPSMLLVLGISVSGARHASSQSPQRSGFEVLAIEPARDYGVDQRVPTIALQSYAGFRKIAESELSSQVPRGEMLSLINRIENAASAVGMNDEKLIALTQHGLREGAKAGLGPHVIFQNIYNALLRIQK
jgi:hypothetical protein